MSGNTVAIIGGGFCGTVAAIRLLTSASRGGRSLPFGSRIVLIEPGRAGEGLAYKAGPDCWRLNVPAEKMSAFPEWPDDFLAWARVRDPQVAGGDFLPRAWYGDYLSERLAQAVRRSPRWLSFERERARATAIDVAAGGARVALTNGTSVRADRVLLALGNSPDAAPLARANQAVPDALDLRWIEDLPVYVPRVMLVGTGLTMIDVVLALAEHRPDARVLAVSRHGLLPQAHADAHLSPASRSNPRFRPVAALAHGTLSQRLMRFRVLVGGDDWRPAIQELREILPAVWRAAPLQLQQRFLRHLRAFWDVHRHRAPRQALERIEALRSRKRLELAAGRVVETRRIKGGIVVAWKPRGGDGIREDLVDAVVNVTGPDSALARSACPLVQSLLEQGLCTPDALGLGARVDRHGRLLDSRGRPSRVLYYVGPWLRARDWEATAVPELRTHVAHTVSALTASLASAAGSYARRIAAPFLQRRSAAL